AVLMIFPVFGAILIVLRRYDLYGFPPSAWQQLVVGALVLTMLAFGLFRETIASEKSKVLIRACIPVLAVAYWYAALLFANCEYDGSNARVWQVQVMNKRISSGSKSTSYYLEVTPWAKYTGENEVDVSRAMYNAVNTNDSVYILLYPGRLGIPWYSLATKN
ncbi:MAG TPA: hypothetical protein VHE54_11575, partial [Puia sp.]|nr:hypothetical protein [Puia sp.]